MRGLSAENITVEFRRPGGKTVRVLDRVSLTVQPGMIVGLTGPSGRGKTTLCRVMTGLTIPTGGKVTCDGETVGYVRDGSGRAVRGRIGMVFQSPRRSCDPRVTLGRGISLTAKPNIDFGEILSSVALTPDLLDRYPAQVSDGQLQRVAMARTLAAKPAYIVFDEMTSMLDPATTATLIDAVKHFVTNGGGVLLVSHDHELVDTISDEIYYL